MTEPSAKTMLIIGCGYAGQAIGRALCDRGVTVRGTTTNPDHLARVAACGATPHLLDLQVALRGPATALMALVADCEAIVYGVGPSRLGTSERFIDHTEALLACLRGMGWRGRFIYLSSTGVYGNRDGEWVDETTPLLADVGPRGVLRQRVEQRLLIAREKGVQAVVLRLAGIYGPGRHMGQRLLSGGYRVIRAEPPLVINRIHVADLAQVAVAALDPQRPDGVYVVADDRPATLREVADYGAELLGLPAPPEQTLADAAKRLGAANLHLVADRKRCKNDLIKQQLGVTLRYPDYRAGLLQAFGADGLLEAGR